MIIPIRCWSCGKPIAHLYEEFVERVKAGEDMKKVLDSIGLERYCCRSTFMGNVELSEHLAKFRKF
jgi:DNA-directed RNA polymerase subunit N (RpoN/RPB10)